MDIYISNKIRINNPTKEMMDFVKSKYVFNNPDYYKRQAMGKSTYRIASSIIMYEKGSDFILLPFGTFKNIYCNFYNKATFNNEIKPIRARNYQSNIKTYDYQEMAINNVLRAKNGILVSPCGSGKTQMGLEIIARIGGKALWITHTKDLMNQSFERAKNNFKLENSEYGLISDGKVNIGNTITFATIQTLNNIDLTEYKNEWDIIVVDEVQHLVGSPTNLMMFYNVLNKLSARYKIGLTATPYRSDGLDQAMFCVMGDIIYEVPKKAVKDKTCNVEVRQMKTNYKPNIDNITLGDGSLVYSSLITDITHDEQRNNLICNIINSLGGSCLVLSDRIEHLQELYNGTIESNKCFIKASNTKKDKEIREMATERMKSGALKYLFASYKLACEGLDIPNLEYIIMATPVKDKRIVVQSCGRVGRKAENKTKGVVIDLIDDFGMLKGYAKKRQSFYKSLNYSIKTID